VSALGLLNKRREFAIIIVGFKIDNKKIICDVEDGGGLTPPRLQLVHLPPLPHRLADYVITAITHGRENTSYYYYYIVAHAHG